MLTPESRNVAIEKAADQLDRADTASRYELRILTKQRYARWLDVTISRFYREATLKTLITAFDISERKRNEQDILNVDPDRFSLVELPRLRCYE